MVAGSLTQGGAEKQLVYMAQALRARGAEVRIYSLTRGEFYEGVLRDRGFLPIWVGHHRHPAARVVVMARAFRGFQPHIVQSTHFFANLYAALAGRMAGALPIGSIRNDGAFDIDANGRWGPWLLRVPPLLIANSTAAQRHAESVGTPQHKIHLVANVINLAEFDRDRETEQTADHRTEPVAITVCRLVPMKRLDRFIRALAIARRQVPALRGLIVGDGPERPGLEALARSIDGMTAALTFAGRSDRVPTLLRQAQMLVHTSDHEGFPNAVLEAMSARLPVVATPAGDVSRVVVHGETGYVVPFDDEDAMAAHMVRLAQSTTLRDRMGAAGRARVEQSYSFGSLGERLLATYRSMAESRGDRRALTALQA
jgi:glycosyltransferase involved in cell wall biosynthesis